MTLVQWSFCCVNILFPNVGGITVIQAVMLMCVT